MNTPDTTIILKRDLPDKSFFVELQKLADEMSKIYQLSKRLRIVPLAKKSGYRIVGGLPVVAIRSVQTRLYQCDSFVFWVGLAIEELTGTSAAEIYVELYRRVIEMLDRLYANVNPANAFAYNCTADWFDRGNQMHTLLRSKYEALEMYASKPADGEENLMSGELTLDSYRQIVEVFESARTPMNSSS